MSNNRHIELAIAAKQAQSQPTKVKNKMHKLGSTLGDLVKLKRQEVTGKDATEFRETHTGS